MTVRLGVPISRFVWCFPIKAYNSYIKVLAAVQNVSRGKFNGRVFTNGWPEFTVVVCQYSPVVQWVSVFSYQVLLVLFVERLIGCCAIYINCNYDAG